jgi:hypothetical protein
VREDDTKLIVQTVEERGQVRLLVRCPPRGRR